MNKLQGIFVLTSLAAVAVASVLVLSGSDRGQSGKLSTSADKPQTEAPLQNESQPVVTKKTPAKAKSLEEWVKRQAEGGAVAGGVPPHIEAVLSSFSLPSELWDEYENQPVENLERRIDVLKQEFELLQQGTEELKSEYTELSVRGETDAAERLMREEILPRFEARDRLLGEAIVVVNAKSLLAGVAARSPLAEHTN